MDRKPSKEMYIGLGLGFFLVLLAGWAMEIPFRDLIIWAVVFAALVFVIGWFMGRARRS